MPCPHEIPGCNRISIGPPGIRTQRKPVSFAAIQDLPGFRLPGNQFAALIKRHKAFPDIPQQVDRGESLRLVNVKGVRLRAQAASQFRSQAGLDTAVSIKPVKVIAPMRVVGKYMWRSSLFRPRSCVYPRQSARAFQYYLLSWMRLWDAMEYDFGKFS